MTADLCVKESRLEDMSGSSVEQSRLLDCRREMKKFKWDISSLFRAKTASVHGPLPIIKALARSSFTNKVGSGVSSTTFNFRIQREITWTPRNDSTVSNLVPI